MIAPSLLLTAVLTAPLAPQDAAQLEAALQAPGALVADELFRACVAEHGSLAPLEEQLQGLIADEAGNVAPRRAAAATLLGHARWRLGAMEPAREAFEAALEADPSALQARVGHARLLDALGEVEAAQAAYDLALDGVTDAALELELRIARALLAMDAKGAEGQDALRAFAETLRAEDRNRAAVVLSLLDRPADALGLFEPREEPKLRARDLLRVAGWQLRADQPEEAASSAWESSLVATLGRERRQALALCIEGHIAAGSLDAMLERFAGLEQPSVEHQEAWNEVLRQTARFDEAIGRLEATAGEDIEPEVRLELLEMYREAGRRDAMLAAYAELVRTEPTRVLWRGGLTRILLEEGDRDGALAAWEGFEEAAEPGDLLEGARALARVGLSERARAWGLRCEGFEVTQVPAQLFLFQMERDAGRVAEALEVLRRMESVTDPGSPARLELSEAFEQVGALEDAVRVLESVKRTRPDGEAGEDLEMRLAWLYSEVGQEEQAQGAWSDLWRRVEALPRRRYVEDRLMTVSSRLGTLADLAIELEEAVLAGEADEKQSALLVRLYTKVGDSVSATEIVDEFFRNAGRGERASLEEKARIYLATNDYFAYEEAVRRLIELDPEGEAEYLRQLAMSMMERGKPEQARSVLSRLGELEADTVAAEFEAGVLALAGMREEALEVYRRGVAAHPNRIDTYLLMGDLLKQTGQQRLALGMFQCLAAFADRDDLFTVAIDGILNQFADGGSDPRTIAWARRTTLARLALRHDKTYLYQLLADLYEEEQDRRGMIRVHETSLPITGPRVASVLRELMDLSRGEGDTFRGSGWQGDPQLFLMFGRRLVASGELVPPQVYLDLGEAFLDAGDADAARRTFALTRDMPDHERFQRDAARLFEAADEVRLSLDAYRALLATAPNDEGLMVKVGELQEKLGDDAAAADLYGRALELLLARRPLTVSRRADEEESENPFLWWGARNTDDWDRWSGRTLEGLLASSSAAELEVRAAEHAALLARDLQTILAARATGAPDRLEEHPRLLRRAEVARRLAFASERTSAVLAMDRALVAAFAEDDASLVTILRAWTGAGYLAAADGLLTSAGLEDEQRLASLGALVGRGGFVSGQALGIEEALRSILPLVASGDEAGVRELLLRIEYGEGEAADLPRLGTLFGAARWLGDQDAALRVGRQWLRLAMDEGRGSFEASAALESIARGLDEERARALHQYLVGRVLEDPARRADYAPTIAEVQRRTGEQFVDEEQALDLLERSGQFYALPTILELLPVEARASALRSTWPRVPAEMRANVLITCVQQSQDELPEAFLEAVRELAPDAYSDAPEYITSFLSNVGEQSANQPAALALLDAWLEQNPGDNRIRGTRAIVLDKLGRTEEALELARELLVVLPPRADGANWEEVRTRELLLERLAPDHADALEVVLADMAPRAAFDLEAQLVAARAGVRAWESHPDLTALWNTVPDRFPEDEVLLEESLRKVRGLRPFERVARLLLDLKADPAIREGLYQRLEGRLRSAGLHAEALAVRLERTGEDEETSVPEDEAEALQGAVPAVGMLPAAPLVGSGGSAPAVALVPAQPAVTVVAGSTAAVGSTPAVTVTPAAAIAIVGGPAGAAALPSGGLQEDDLAASPQAVAEALRDGDAPRAARVLRRFWREFQVGIEPESRFPVLRYGPSPMGRFRWTGEVPPEDDGPEDDGAAEGDAPEAGDDLANEDSGELAEEAVAEGAGDDDGSGSTAAEAAADGGTGGEVSTEPETTPLEPVPAGGLSQWQDSIERTVQERPDALAILTRYPEVVEELRRVLQTQDGSGLDGEQLVVEAVADADAAARGLELAVTDRVAALADGDLGKRGQMELLALLDEAPELEEAREVVRTLVGAVSPLDAAQARRLARVLARAGAQEEAVRLYRWCATRAGESARFSFSPFEEQGSTVTVTELVEEAKEVISEDRRLELVESILGLSVAPDYPWAREQAELERLRVWEELAGPKEAFRRAQELCESSIDLSQGLRRSVALRSAALFAHAGELGGAVRALEIGIARLPEDEVKQPEQVFYRSEPGEPGSLRDADLRRLLAPDLCAGEAGGRLLTGVEDALLTWLAEERVRPDDGVRALAVCGLRRLERGEDDRARALGAALAAREDRLARSPLWVADLNARAGASDVRDRIEEDLLVERRLGFQREVPALRRIAQREGATRALELAAELARESRPNGLLGWMEEAATAEGLEEEAARWKAARLADEAASKRLQELDQAEAQAAAGELPGMSGALKVVPGAAMQIIRIGP